MSQEKEDLYMRFWPPSDSTLLRELRDDPNLVFYDEETIPRAFQVWDEQTGIGLRDTRDGTLTANNEFPWREAAGIPPETKVQGIKFVRLTAPIAWWRQPYADGTFARYAWEFPTDTVFGEILIQTDSQGYDHTWEMRIRRKRANGKWAVNAYRPFPEETDFQAALARRGIIYEPEESVFRETFDDHQRNRFVASGWSTRPPAMDEDLVKSLLKEPFKSARSRSWRTHEDGQTVESPTTSMDFSIVPRGFLGHALPVDSKACMRCHEDAGKQVNLEGDRRWRLRGGDGIFSWHPFDPTSVGGLPVLNRKLVAAGFLEHRPGLP